MQCHELTLFQFGNVEEFSVSSGTWMMLPIVLASHCANGCFIQVGSHHVVSPFCIMSGWPRWWPKHQLDLQSLGVTSSSLELKELCLSLPWLVVVSLPNSQGGSLSFQNVVDQLSKVLWWLWLDINALKWLLQIQRLVRLLPFDEWIHSCGTIPCWLIHWTQLAVFVVLCCDVSNDLVHWKCLWMAYHLGRPCWVTWAAFVACLELLLCFVWGADDCLDCHC